MSPISGAWNFRKYVHRGDPANADFQLGDFTTDYAWHDLDLSTIIPEGSALVKIKYVIRATTGPGQSMHIRKKGINNEQNKFVAFTQSWSAVSGDFDVQPDENRIVQYKFQNTTWNLIDFLVRGWFV